MDAIASVTYHRRPGTAQRFVERLSDDLTLEMVVIPNGTFLMGSHRNESSRTLAEGPQHDVTVSSFLLGRYPVTQTQWMFVAELPTIEIELEPDPSTFKGASNPVERINWYEATEFCARLTAHTKRLYRLPSEAEWEYACRAGAQTPFHFGHLITTDVANYCGEDKNPRDIRYDGAYGKGPMGIYLGKTAPVGHAGVANAFGLCDMHGNVFEWCEDYWHESYPGAPVDGSAWITDNLREHRVRRGGSWDTYPGLCRSASRRRGNPIHRRNTIGMRVACQMSTPVDS